MNMMEEEKEKTRRAILALIEMARLNFPSSSDVIKITVEGKHMASIDVNWVNLAALIKERGLE